MSTAANPRADQLHPSDAPQEPTGAVASDSLAAESLKSGGGFSENENAHALGVSGSKSTLNTTDTSGATVLPAATSGAARTKEEVKGLGSDERGVTGPKYPDTDGQPSFDGTHSAEGYVGGASHLPASTTRSGAAYSGASGDSFGDETAVPGSSSGADPKISSGAAAVGTGQSTRGNSSTTGYGTGHHPIATGRAGEDFGTSSVPSRDTAPNYAATVAGGIRSEAELKPKGENLTEGGIPETKTFTGDVGGQHDPGRVAELGFQKVSAENAASASTAKYSENDGETTTGGKFDVLSSERA